MDFKKLFFTLLFTLKIFASPALPDPVLIAVLMIKDEAPVIVSTLEPLVAAGIDAYYIFDTGSTDNTVELVHNFFKEKNITKYRVGQEPFIDFASSRNRALDLCEEAFPNGGFMLMLDAEWHLINGQDLISWCKAHADKIEYPQSSFLIQIKSSNLDFHVQRLIRCKSTSRFKGVVHENIEHGSNFKVCDTSYFELHTTRFGADKTLKRMRERDVPALLKEYRNNPHNSRTTFYLAQTYECIGDWENAYKYYKRRTEMTGWPEEDFIARYKLGVAIENLKEIDHVQAWPQALHQYLEAFAMRPSRIETLVRIANYYLSKDNFHLSYIFAKRACEIPYPKDDVLFIEKKLYEYERYDILGRVAWYVGEFEAGEEAIRNALKHSPNSEHLKKNLEFYVGRKK